MERKLIAVLFTTISMLLAPLPTSADEDPFAPIDKHVLCSWPDFQQRTCKGMSAFKEASDNQYLLNETFVTKFPPFYQITAKSIAYAKQGMICVAADSSAISLSFSLGGKPIDKETQEALRNKFAKRLESLGIVEICERLTPLDICGHKLLHREAYFNGVAQPAEQEPGANYSAWVGQADGFVLREGGVAADPPENSCRG